MTLLVQKFGGTSVADVERIQAVAQRIAASREAGHELVVVVSAMGHSTDTLMALAQAINADPPPREMDMLLATGEQVSIALIAMALQRLGVPAVSLTGSQAGIITESAHGRARILEIHTERLWRWLEEGCVVVVAGFQGTSGGPRGLQEITTLGRGGSDTTAVALAAALGAVTCEIYTDVAGVFSTDPRKVRDAQLMKTVSCDEMLELASLGASVLHPRAVEIARNYGVPLLVRSSMTDEPGTILTSGVHRAIGHGGLELGKPVDGAQLEQAQAVLALSGLPDHPGVAARLFEALGAAGLNVDLIVQATHEGQSNDIAFTVAEGERESASLVCRRLLEDLRADGAKLTMEGGMAKISISGAGIMGRPGVAARLFDTMARLGINLRLIATSEVKVSCVVEGGLGDKALRAAAEAFELGDGQLRQGPLPADPEAPAVRGVALDLHQVQVTVKGVPDRPGMAAAVCRCLADAGISLDAIVQAERLRPAAEGGASNSRDMSFILRKGDRPGAEGALRTLLRQWPGASFVEGPAIARVSAVGAGMACTAGTAARMFRALADAAINIEMIATSEIRTSCVVAEADGVRALRAVHQTFGLGGPASHRVEGSEAPL